MGSVSSLSMFGACSIAPGDGSGYKLKDADQPIATDGVACRSSSRPPLAPETFLQVLAARLHAGAAVRLPGRARVLRPELSSRRGALGRLARVADRDRPDAGAGSHHP